MSSPPPTTFRVPSFVDAARLAVAVVLLVTATGRMVAAQEVPPPHDDAAAEAHAGEGHAAEEDAERIARRRRTVAAMVWIVVGVAIVGVTLLLCVLFWGAHTRRVVRSPLPGQTRDDPFWYLKGKRGGEGPADEEGENSGSPDAS